MSEFVLNKPRNRKPPHAFYSLSMFAKGYVEAMFFTNGDTGDEVEDKSLNDLGVERLTRSSVEAIARDCEKFWSDNESDLQAALSLEPGSSEFRYGREELDDARLGNLFWYARQGHGVSFTDDGDASCLERLQEAAQRFGECYVEVSRGWIYCR